MASLQTDNNVADVLVTELRARAHTVSTARELGLVTATDALHLLRAAQAHRVLLTADDGYPPLHEAWTVWTTELGFAGPHGGIVTLQRYGRGMDSGIAEMIDHALRLRWKPAGAMWLLNVRLGWKRLQQRSSTRADWSGWAFSPLALT